MIKQIKLEYSKLNAEFKKYFVSCGSCNQNKEYGNRVVLDHINDNGYWEYSIKCNYCGFNVYSSTKN